MPDKLAPEKRSVKEKMEPQKGPFAGPVLALREALGLAQEAAARQIRVALNTWRAWEYGIQQPRRQQLEAIAGLTDSPGLRMKFWLDIYAEGSKMGGTHDRPMNPRERLIMRYINDSVIALRELSLAAAEGSTASEEILKDVADKLLRAAGDSARSRETGASRQKR